jgi:predicted transposase YdaD
MKPTEDEVRLVRNFAENSVKFLLLNRDNAREGLTLMAPEHAPLIDFGRMEVLRTTFVAPDFRHLETDLLLKAPMAGKHGRGRRAIYVYQLIEHQSAPDELAEYRAMRYQLQVFDLQQREWQEKHGTLRGIQFDPVLPIVIYTGARTWEKLTPFRDLVRQGHRFADQTPVVKPVFFNLTTTPAEKLHREAGLFGRVLHLMQQRRAKPADYRALLAEVVRYVDTLPKAAQGRWHDLLWYLRAMVYHVREKQEHGPLEEVILEAERAKSRQAEVIEMGKTMAEVLIERGMREGKVEGKREGRLEGKREQLLELLKEKFQKVPKAVESLLRETQDEAKLAQWSKEVLWADTLADMSFPSGD